MFEKMSRTTSKRAIVEALSKVHLEKFHFCLRDRGVEPRVTWGDVEGKSVGETADMLFSKFTESGAVKVTLEMLREMNCNEEAARLGESRVGIPCCFCVKDRIRSQLD